MNDKQRGSFATEMGRSHRPLCRGRETGYGPEAMMCFLPRGAYGPITCNKSLTNDGD